MGLQHIAPLIEADNRRAVIQATWGHLAARKGKSYKGRIIYAVGIYGSDCHNPTALVSEFEGLDNSPWEYDAVQSFLQHEDTPKDEGCVYEFTGTMRNYECEGEVRQVFNANLINEQTQEEG